MPLQTQPFMQPVDGSGKPYPGALAYYFQHGTSTPADVYTSAEMDVAHAHPVVANANGVFPDIYTDPAITYRLVLQSAGGSAIADVDPTSGGGAVGSDDLQDGAVVESKLADDAVSSRTIADQAISSAKMANMPTHTVKGNKADTSTVPTDLTGVELANAVLGDALAGSVHQFAHATWSTSVFLLCNGQAVSRTTYARLFGKIGTVFGTGDGTTTFNVPDYRGAFLRGHDHSRGLDPDGNRAYSNQQGSDNKAHTHTSDKNTSNSGRGDSSLLTHLPGYGSGAGKAITDSTGLTEARPTNYPVDIVIWY